MATHSSTLAWENAMDRGACGLQSMGSQRVGYDWATEQQEHWEHLWSYWGDSGWAPGWELVTRKTRIKSFGFWVLLPSSREGSQCRNGDYNWSYLCEEATIKFQKYGVQRSSRLANTSTCLGLTHPNSTGTEAPVLRTRLIYLFIWLFIWRPLPQPSINWWM